MRKCSPLLLAIVALIPGVALAQAVSTSAVPPPPPAQTAKPSRGTVTVIDAAVWEMTDGERIERRAAAAVTSKDIADRGSREKIEGRRNPELFLSYELYDFLLWGLSDDVKRQQAAHTKFDPKIRASGYDVAKFWRALHATAEPYIELRNTRGRQGSHATMITSPVGTKVLVPVDRDVCAARITALEQTRRIFGRRSFDRLLYSVVAPTMSHTSSTNSPSDVGVQLRYMAGGCK